MRKKLKPAPAPALRNVLVSILLLLFFSATSYSQKVSGTVSDANNQLLPGVTVQVKNTSRATVTNDAGRFEINAAGNDMLVFSFVGFATQEAIVFKN